MLDTLEAIDRALLLKINSLHAPWLDTLMWYVSETWPTFLLVFIIAWFIFRRMRTKKAVEFLLGCLFTAICTDLSSNAMKHAVKRYRPTHNIEIQTKVRVLNQYMGGKYGFFSGHAANTFGVVTFIYLSVSWIRRKYILLISIYPFLVVYSRMYLGVHYPSDIIMGMIDGIFFGWLVYNIMNSYFLKPDEQKM
jgi:undecaprenyl-diphosphatase